MIINHNMSAINSYRSIKFRNASMSANMEKLSSGIRINKAGDDASGLAVSEKMRAQIRGLRQAARNAEDDISLVQTTEGYLQQIQEVLHRLRELAVQASNGIYTSQDREQIQVEVSQLIDEIDRIASHAQFNELNVLTGRYANPNTETFGAASMWFHIGANMDQRERIFIATMNSQALGLKNPDGLAQAATFISYSTMDKANLNISKIDVALNKVSKQRADLGAYQNRLEFASQGLMASYENLQASESLIRDADMAEEMVDFVKNQILMQTNMAMLGQANLKSQLVLKILYV